MNQNLAPEYLMDYLRGDLDFVMTSGSTGTCLDIYWNKGQNKKSMFPLWMLGIGDMGTIYKKHSCLCGNTVPIIELTAARDNDYIRNKDGSRISSDIFCHVIERINLYFGHCVDQYQIVQVNDIDFDIYWVLDSECEVDNVRKMFVDFLEEFGRCHRFCFHEINCLMPSEKTDKLAWFCARP